MIRKKTYPAFCFYIPQLYPPTILQENSKRSQLNVTGEIDLPGSMTILIRRHDLKHRNNPNNVSYSIMGRLYNAQRAIQVLFFLLALLYFGQRLFIPLFFAMLLSLILYPVTRRLEQWGWPKILAICSSLTVMIFLFAALLALFIGQLSAFLNRWPQMQQKLQTSILELWLKIGPSLGISSPNQEWIDSVIRQGMGHLINWLPQGIYLTSVNLILILIVPFYVVLILYYRGILVDTLHRLFDYISYADLKEMLGKSIHTYFQFIKGVSLVYLLVGTLNSVGLAILGIPNALMFGFIASILTFIPYIGITVGASLPMAVAWLTYDSLFYPLGVILVFVFVQILEANVIFPLVVSHHLKINALAAIIAIVMGGIIWGAAGMILFLPMVAILKLVLDQIDRNHPLAILLQS